MKESPSDQIYYINYTIKENFFDSLLSEEDVKNRSKVVSLSDQ